MLAHRTLKALLEVERTHSLKEAAAGLSISPSTLTRLVQEAEQTIGFEIFQRDRSGAFPTNKGRLLLMEAARFIETAKAFDSNVADIREGHSGLVKIGCGPLATLPVVLPLIGGEETDSRGVRFIVKVEAEADPVSKLINGVIDLFVGDLTHTTAVSELEVVKLKPRPMVVVAHSDHPIHKLKSCRLADLVAYKLAMPHFHRYWQKSFELSLQTGSRAISKRTDQLLTVECDDYGLLIELAKHHGFITGGSRENFEAAIAGGELAEVKMKPAVMWNLCCARRLSDQSEHIERLWKKILKQ